jgi:methionine aminopeptidase
MKQAGVVLPEARGAIVPTARTPAVTALIACAMTTFAATPLSAQVGSPAGAVPVDVPEQRRSALLDAIGNGVAVVMDIGAEWAELTRIAQQYMETNSGDVCGSESRRRYFLHGRSHWLGMDVHDVGDYARPLEPGMVLTIEPGICIASEQIGVRIEDADPATTTKGNDHVLR